MENYLREQYDVIELEYLTHESEIVDYFMDNGKEYFDCGQGYCTDEIELICKISDSFYKITIFAEITSAKQDVGDRLYWVDYISGVLYEKIDKPTEKSIVTLVYTLTLTDYQKKKLDKFIKDNNIVVKTINN